MTIFTILLDALIILAVLIFMILTHELGHYGAAKLVKVKVNQFSIGFGPEITGWNKGETRYSLKWFLAGGSVRICGMDPEEEVSEEDFPRSYHGVPHWKRAVIIIAGSFVHFVIAMILFFLILCPIGLPVLTGKIDKVPKTVEISTNRELPSPAYEAGLKKGDLITSVDGKKVSNWTEITEQLSSHPNETVTIEYKRDGRKNSVDAKLLKTSDDRGILGIQVNTNSTKIEKLPPGEAAWEAVKITGTASWGLIKGIGMLFSPKNLKMLIGVEKRTQEGPRSIVGAVQLSFQAAEISFSYLLMMIAQFFLLLSIFNLIPLPPLDGGYLLVIIIEKVFHREIDLRKLAPIAWVVIVVLLLVALRLAYLDLFNPLKSPFSP